MRNLALASCLAATVMTLTACAPSPATHLASTAGSDLRQDPLVTGVMDLLGPETGVVGLYVQSGIGRSAHFVITRNGGRTFVPFGPVASNQDIPDSVFFLNPMDGWLASFPGAGGPENVQRTSNGGLSWQQLSAPGHVTAGGSTDAVWFVSPMSGWLADIEPTGPAEELRYSMDGGATWRCIAGTVGSGGCPGTLPQLGPVRFEPGGLVGWLGGGMYSTALYRTSDGGRSWQRMRISAPSGAIFGLPTVLGQAVIEPVTAAVPGGYSLLTFASPDNGANWKLESVLQRAGAGTGCGGPMSASFPSASAGWAAAFRNGRAVIYRSAGLGRPWDVVAEVGPQARGGSECAEIQAADSDHAWLDDASGFGITIWATSDGGRSWVRIDRAAEAGGDRGR